MMRLCRRSLEHHCLISTTCQRFRCLGVFPAATHTTDLWTGRVPAPLETRIWVQGNQMILRGTNEENPCQSGCMEKRSGELGQVDLDRLETNEARLENEIPSF